MKKKKVQETANTFSYQKGSLTWTCKECGSVSVVLMVKCIRHNVQVNKLTLHTLVPVKCE